MCVCVCVCVYVCVCVCVYVCARESERLLGECLVWNQTRVYSETRPHTCTYAPSLACVDVCVTHSTYIRTCICWVWCVLMRGPQRVCLACVRTGERHTQRKRERALAPARATALRNIGHNGGSMCVLATVDVYMHMPLICGAFSVLARRRDTLLMNSKLMLLSRKISRSRAHRRTSFSLLLRQP